MSKITIRSRWAACGMTIAMNSLFGVCALAADKAKGAPIPPSPEFTSPDIKPTFRDWLTAKPMALAKKLKVTDPLQKPPFAGAPVDSLKGMAAGIRGVQLDAPNRVKAVKYLGSVDCVTYPQAQEMLIATMQEDPSEEVRYEAVLALRAMLSRGCSNMDTSCECEPCCNRKQVAKETERHAKKAQQELIKEAKGPAKKLARQVSRDPEEKRYDCCRGCTNEKVLKALVKVAYEKDDQCCWIEPSERVREAAAEGLCLVVTSPAPYGEPASVPAVPPTDDKPKDKEVAPPDEKEAAPPQAKEAALDLPPPAPARLETTSTTSLRGSIRPGVTNNASLPSVGMTRQVSSANPVTGGSRPVIAGLKGFCVVALKERQFVPTNAAFSSTFEDHTYFFSNAEAKATFDRNPESYAPAYGGFDPVVWLEQRQMVEGQFLREFEGRFYLFTSKENWETFKSTPQRFVLREGASPRNVVAR